MYISLTRSCIPCCLSLAGVLFASLSLYAQEFPRSEAEYDSIYAARIVMEEIDGVYIPRDLEDVFAELRRLSSAADLEKLRRAPEDVVRTRLHFGLGRWMIINWGFYEGSRLSHHLKEAGLLHPDDMARVLIVCFHRHLHGSDLRFAQEVEYYHTLREKEREEREKHKQVISEEKHVRKD